MIYLTTGANGAGKTLLTLKEVHDKSIKESRPVYHNGRFEIAPGGPLSNWQRIDTRDWQSVPDGAIFVIDECQHDFPVRSGKEPAAEYILMMAEHRRRGFDFYLITQHPLNIDAFVRRLIGSPGWHRHLKRASGAPLVSVLEWPSVHDQPQKMGSGESGSVKMVPYPKEVYSWYVSTQLDTAKLRIPFQVKLLAALALIVPLAAWYGWSSFNRALPKPPSTSSAGGPANPSSARVAQSLTPAEYTQSFQPRVPGLSYTATRYDEVTKPVVAPYPAACISMGPRCECYTQQATKLPVPDSLCREIVKGGFFLDWQQAVSDAGRGAPIKSDPMPVPSAPVSAPPMALSVAPEPLPDAEPSLPHPSRLRNSPNFSARAY